MSSTTTLCGFIEDNKDQINSLLKGHYDFNPYQKETSVFGSIIDFVAGELETGLIRH